MAKAYYEGITFDSDLEVEYYKYLLDLREKGIVYEFSYHPSVPIQITAKNSYTPDFIVGYEDRLEIIETKGYNQFSYKSDNITHSIMLSKSEEDLRQWLSENNILWKGKIVYRKIKYLNTFGWVDFDFKNPNTLANKRKEKIVELESELKELKAFKKDTIRYWKLFIKSIAEPKKITKSQEEFMDKYSKELNEYLKEESKK